MNESRTAPLVAAYPRPRRAVYAYRDTSPSTGALVEALSQAQAEFGVVAKDATGQYGKFASMASMRKATVAALAKFGLAVTMECADTDEHPYLVCVLAHKSDQFVSSTFRLERIGDAQKRSAYLTYMKRAAYSAILCLAAEDDDDGEAAVSAEAEAKAAAVAEQFRLAKDALKGSKSRERVAQILDKVAAKTQAGELTSEAAEQLRIFAASQIASMREGVPA
jgi:hypothetical protein